MRKYTNRIHLDGWSIITHDVIKFTREHLYPSVQKGFQGLSAGYKIGTCSDRNGKQVNVWAIVCTSLINLAEVMNCKFYDTSNRRTDMEVGDIVYILPHKSYVIDHFLKQKRPNAIFGIVAKVSDVTDIDANNPPHKWPGD